ncbi:putative dentin sialophosphoprotein-like [Sesbania bispinosa]|nr:putative dentin sialophosphoprotein-like [Sesbania bispinosa]
MAVLSGRRGGGREGRARWSWWVAARRLGSERSAARPSGKRRWPQPHPFWVDGGLFADERGFALE